MRAPLLSAIVIAAVLAACSANADEASPADEVTVPMATSADVGATDTSVEQTAPPSVELGAQAWSAVYGFGAVWIQVDPPVDQLVKVDEVSGVVTLTVDGGTAAAVSDDAMWVTVGGSETRKIDPVTGDVLLSVPTPDAYYITFGAGAVWVPSMEGVTRIDPVSGAIAATIALDSGVTDLEASDDAVWTTHKEDGSVTRIDPATNAVVANIETGPGAHDLVIDDSGVWITNYQANTVSRIDPLTNTVVTTITGVGSGVGISAGDGDIFVGNRAGDISRIDPDTNEARLVISLDGWPYGLAYGEGELWATNADTGVVFRLNASLLGSG